MMDYQQRVAAARREISRFLARYTPPRALSQDAQDATFSAICEAVNKRIPARLNADQYRSRIEAITEIVADTHTTNAWPLQAEFVAAAAQVAGRNAKDMAAGDGPAVSSLQLNASRVMAGEAVGDCWLYGRLAHRLLNSGVSDEQLAPYRRALFEAEREQYGEEAALARRVWREKMHKSFRVEEGDENAA